MKRIIDIIDAEHKKIIELLDKAISSKDMTGGEFSKFKWYLEKHMFTEEKAIFESFQNIKEEEVNEEFDLIEQHGAIMSLIKEIESNKLYSDEAKLNELKGKVKAHEGSESEFYDMLNETLTDEQTKEIVDKFLEAIKA